MLRKRVRCGRSKYPIWKQSWAWAVLLFIMYTVTNWGIMLHVSRSTIAANHASHVARVANRTIDDNVVPGILKKHAVIPHGKIVQFNKRGLIGDDNTMVKNNKYRNKFGLRHFKVPSPHKSHEPAIPLVTRDTTSYSRLSKDISTPQDFQLLLPGRGICGNSSLVIIFLVPTVHAETEVRHAIRNTWGSYKGVDMRTAFLLGVPPTDEISALIHRESTQYGDIVMANFTDSYENLSYKVLMGLRWAGLFCRQAGFVVKADSDMFVNVTALVNALRKNPPGRNGTIYGGLSENSLVLRQGKWGMSKEMYPFKSYPPYMQGPCYAMSINLAEPLYTASQHYPYLSIEDALITGCLARLVNAQQKDVEGFVVRALPLKRSACTYLNSYRFVTLTFVTPRMMYDLWSALPDYPQSCRGPG